MTVTDFGGSVTGWYAWAVRSRIDPVKQVAATVEASSQGRRTNADGQRRIGSSGNRFRERFTRDVSGTMTTCERHLPMKLPTFVLSTVIAVCLVAPVATMIQVSDATTLRERARAKGGKIRVVTEPEVALAPLELVTSGAELIVQGRIVEEEPRLNENETAVLTHFTIAPTHVFKNAIGVGVRPLPGPTRAITFVEPGGTVHIDGLEISYEDTFSAKPRLQVGEEIIVFLVKRSQANAFRLYHGSFGLLRVRHGKVVAANEEVARVRPLERDGLDDVQRGIEQIVRRRR